MKLWEAMKYLAENPGRKFKKSEVYREWTLSTQYDDEYQGCVYVLSCGGEWASGEKGQFSGNLTIDNDRWQLVPDQVSMEEAIQAWKKGYVISVEYERENQKFKDRMIPTAEYLEISRDAAGGQWFIDDKYFTAMDECLIDGKYINPAALF